MGHRGMRLVLAICAGLLGAVVGASPALAHNSFTGSNPAEGATVEKAPEEIELRFLEEVDAAATKISIKAPHGASGMKGDARFDGAKIFVPFGVGQAGEYTVSYEIPSDDGHPVKGDFSFTLTEAAVAAAAPTPTAEPTTAAPAPAEVPATDAPVLDNAASSENDGGAPWWPWAVGGLLLVVAIAGGAITYGRRTAA